MTDYLQILVVDDEDGMRSGIERILSDFSVRLPEVNNDVRFKIEQAATGEQALEMICSHCPDIILLDHKLPGISGLDILKQIAGCDNDILTVMITAYASIETAVTATKRGAYDFLAKPFTPNDLKHVISKTTKHLMLQRQARQLAEEKRQVRFQFISVLAHELKAPTAAIEGYLRIIKDRSAGDDVATYDHMISRSLIRLEGMRKMIADLLDLTRIESGQLNRNLQSEDVKLIADESIETFASLATEKDVNVELHCDGPMTMTVDKGEVEIILNNLISNAIKYNRSGGKVDVTLSNDGKIVTISVADTGIGMTDAEAERLFGEFVRIKNSKTRNIVGSGLGLSIVKKLAHLYGGDVTVDSKPDVGTTFTVTLLPSPAESNNESV